MTGPSGQPSEPARAENAPVTVTITRRPGRWHVSRSPSLAVPSLPSQEACPGRLGGLLSGRAGGMVSCQISRGGMLPSAVFGSMSGVRCWQHKTTTAPQASREHASANGRGSMGPRRPKLARSMPPAHRDLVLGGAASGAAWVSRGGGWRWLGQGGFGVWDLPAALTLCNDGLANVNEHAHKLCSCNYFHCSMHRDPQARCLARPRVWSPASPLGSFTADLPEEH